MDEFSFTVHVGRLNFVVNKLRSEKPHIFPEFYSKMDNLVPECKNIIDHLIDNDQWSNEDTKDTDQALVAREYWFEFGDFEEKDPCKSLDMDMHPHDRWLQVKDRLNELHVLQN